jgi:cobyrinic acid a,c-diamide synthase
MAAAWKKQGREVVPFKKGPDYIDAAWLSLAAGQPCRNLDTFLMGRQGVLRSFFQKASAGSLSLVEGNRGLYDGMDVEGSHSTAELAKLLRAPVVLVIDCDKVTRTASAMILGCQRFDPGVGIKGVILNRVAGSRHEKILQIAVEQSCNLPILGAVPRMEDFPFPERHLGLTPPQEHLGVQRALAKALEIADQYLDLARLWEIAEEATPLRPPAEEVKPQRIRTRDLPGSPTIGVVKDSAFQFYYPENLQGLSDAGARVVEVSAIRERELPPVDALYIGGGFPETHVRPLAENVSFRKSLREAVENGLPVYAECGGFMYLGESLMVGGQSYPMVGALPVAFKMERRPQGHGYTVLEVEKENPFFARGTVLRGHEFHYSRILRLGEGDAQFTYRVMRGVGIAGGRDGLCRKNILATYSHLHALGTEGWAEALVTRAMLYRERQIPGRVAV